MNGLLVTCYKGYYSLLLAKAKRIHMFCILLASLLASYNFVTSYLYYKLYGDFTHDRQTNRPTNQQRFSTLAANVNCQWKSVKHCYANVHVTGGLCNLLALSLKILTRNVNSGRVIQSSGAHCIR